MARTIYDDDIVLGLQTADGKPVFRKPVPVEAKPVQVRDEAAEHRAAMLAQSKITTDLLAQVGELAAQNAELIEAMQAMIVRPGQVDAWEFTIQRDDDGLAKTVKATPTKRKSSCQ